MFRAAFPRILLAACVGLLLVTFMLAWISAPTAAIAGDNPSTGWSKVSDPLPGTTEGLHTAVNGGGAARDPSAALRAGLRRTEQQQSSIGTLCFVSEGATSCVDRAGIQSTGTLTDRVRSLMQAMVAGPTAPERARGVRSSLPAGAALIDVRVATDRGVIRFDLPASFLSTFDAGHAEDVNEQVATTLTPFNFARIDVEVSDPSQPDTFRPLSSFLPPIPIPTKPGEIDTDTLTPPYSIQGGQPPANGQPQSKGGLSGKTVFVSAGHGWYWNSTLSQYRTQRPVYPSAPYPAGEGTVEDFNNAEVVNQYLLPYLWNAGADAWTVRERDMNASMTIVDDVSPAFSLQGSWRITTAPGGYTSAYVYSGTYLYTGTYFYTTTVTSGATATATWAFTPAIDAEYAVYVWFPNASNRTPAARYTVDHAGGTTVLTLTQARDGINWRYIGAYPFRAGAAGRVRLSNRSTVAGKTVLADAIRIGGGIGDVTLSGTLAPSGKPRWEEQSRQYATWVGLPDPAGITVTDVTVRPIYSEWEYESGEDGVYIAWHTNGFSGYNTTARGTETYIHSFEPTTHSNILQNYIHTELLNDIHAGWESTWPDRGRKSRDLGELRLLETLPGVLIENGFHDNPQDTDAIKDPRFNLLSARAVYQGIVRYWNARDANVPLVFLPEPPTHLRVRNSGPNQVTLAWRPGPTDTIGLLGQAATSYRVYTSADGFGWGDAISTASTALTLTGLAPGQLIHVRVTGVNAGGESFPTPALAARVASNDIAPVLIVYGFERIDRLGLIQQNDPPEGNSRRMFLDRINRYDYIIQHATGITRAFDSAVHAAVTDGEVGLGNYAVVDWIAGEEQSPDAALNATDQPLLQLLLDGGALLISGAEIGFDLVGNGVGPSFYSDALRASFVAGDAGTYSISPVGGGIFDSLGTFSFDDGTRGAYDADWPDQFTPQGGALGALLYNGGLGGTAALSYANGPCTRLIYMGFPLETIYPQSTRRALMSRAIAFLDDCVASTGPDTSITSPSDGAAYNTLPAFNGIAGGPGGISSVQVALLSGTQYYNGSTFVPVETWLAAAGTVTWNYVLPSLPDGDYALKARAIAPGPLTDAIPAAITFTIDTVPPDIPTLLTPIDGAVIPTRALTFTWTGSGGPSGFDFELDGVVKTLKSPTPSLTRNVTEGVHTWRVRAFDRAGNYSNWSAPTTFTVDTIPPGVPTLIAPLDGAAIPTHTLTFAWIGSGDPSGFDFELDGAITTLDMPVLSLTRSVTEGMHTWRVRAFDRAGTYSNWSAPA
ncbi:MAG: N-acetylmuramoyl-L-alanine amidase, partial [Anaerolineae bacterium]